MPFVSTWSTTDVLLCCPLHVQPVCALTWLAGATWGDHAGRAKWPKNKTMQWSEKGQDLLMRLKSKHTEPKGSEKNCKDLIQCIC